MCTGLVNAQTSDSGNGLIGTILGIVSTIVTIVICCCFCCAFYVKLYKHIVRSQEQRSMSPRVQLPSTTYGHPLQPHPEPSYTIAEATNTSTGLPHSTVPLESELQNVPPPAYSTAHQYPVYTQPDEATSQNKTVNGEHIEEPTAEAPPSYDEEPIKEPPPPYPSQTP